MVSPGQEILSQIYRFSHNDFGGADRQFRVPFRMCSRYCLSVKPRRDAVPSFALKPLSQYSMEEAVSNGVTFEAVGRTPLYRLRA